MQESIFKNNEQNKTKLFAGNDKLNEIISELKYLLKPIQLAVQSKYSTNKFPVGFIVGGPRSGTTLFLQWLASLEKFAYPTNILTRFSYAPYIGALIQKMLFDKTYDFHNQFEDLNTGINFNSNLGKSQGALGVNEFQHFLRNYMQNFDPEFLNEEDIKNVDLIGIRKGIASIEEVFNKPFVLKAMMLQFNIIDLYNTIPSSIFFYVKRKPIYIMQSILFARENYYGERNIWWSAKPKEYNFLKNLDVYHQIAGQVYFIKKSLNASLSKLPEKNKITIDYNTFCKKPIFYFKQIVEKYKANGYEIKNKYDGINKFESSDKLRLHEDEIEKLCLAYDYFENNKIE